MVQTRGQAASAALDHPQVIDLTTEITEIELKTEATKLEALTPFEKFLTGRLHAEDLKPAAEVNQSNDTEVIVAPDNEGPTTRNKNYRSSTNQAAYDAGAGLREQRRQKREQRRQKREQQQQGKAESQRRRELDREARELEADERERLADESRRAQLALQDRKERLKEKLMADRAANIARKEERRIAAAAEQEVARLRKEENQKAHEAKEAERQAKKAEKKRVKAAEQEALTLKYQERKRARQAEHETRYPLTKKPKPDPDQANGSTQHPVVHQQVPQTEAQSAQQQVNDVKPPQPTPNAVPLASVVATSQVAWWQEEPKIKSLSHAYTQPVEVVENILGWPFKDRQILMKACPGLATRRKTLVTDELRKAEHVGNNVLALIGAQRAKSKVGSTGKTVSDTATRCRTHKILTATARKTGLIWFRGNYNTNEKLVGKAMMALVGAVHLDGGLDAAAATMEKLGLI